MDILVLSPCSRSKQFPSVLDCEAVDTHPRNALLAKYGNRATAAEQMYTGAEHRQVTAAVSELRKMADVDWNIVSAGFGLLEENTQIPSYECGFSDVESVRRRAERAGYDTTEMTNAETIRAVGREKAIPSDFRKSVTRGYDLLFVVLSEPYLLSVEDALADLPDGTTGLAFASRGSNQHVGECTWVPATETERRSLETTWMELRGRLLRELATLMSVDSLERLPEQPELALEVLSAELSD